jgi:hypothetical protein
MLPVQGSSVTICRPVQLRPPPAAYPTSEGEREREKETWVSASLLTGLLPTALLQTHAFWQDRVGHMVGYPHGYPPQHYGASYFIDVTLDEQQTGG